MNIYKTGSNLTYIENDNFPEGLKSVLKYAIEQYSFLMFPKRVFTAGELAETIKASYDMANSVNYAVVTALEFAQENS
jgi:hypothetical protein